MVATWAAMSPDQVTHTLTMFDAFLAFTRSASAVAAHPPLTDVSTAVTAVRGSSPVELQEDGVSDGDVTRVTALPIAEVERTTPRAGDWEEPTHERPDIMRALARSDAAQPDTDVSIKLPKAPKADPRVDQASIIIEDDSLTEPEFRREDVLRAMAEHARTKTEELPPATTVEEFGLEMQVLVKYGHAAQAVTEIDRWVTTRPGDAEALAAVTAAVRRAASRAARRE